MQGGNAWGFALNCGSLLRCRPWAMASASCVPGGAKGVQGTLLRTLGFVLLLCVVGAWAQQPASSAAPAGSPAPPPVPGAGRGPQEPPPGAWGGAGAGPGG